MFRASWYQVSSLTGSMFPVIIPMRSCLMDPDMSHLILYQDSRNTDFTVQLRNG